MTENPPEEGDALTEEEISELRFSQAQSFFDKSVGVRILIGVGFALLLFLFFHLRETYVETLELGTDANKYVVAQIDFAFPDEEATIILKQEASYAIGTIYKIDEEQIYQKASDFQKYVSQNEEGKKRWEQVSRESDFDDLALLFSLFSDGLMQSRFTNVRTVKRIQELPEGELPIPVRYFFPYIPTDLQGRLPVPFWAYFAKMVFSKEIPSSVSLFLLHYFEPISWEFVNDQGTEYTIRKLAQAKISPKFTRIRAGERIIDQGETITTRHISMMQAMKEKLNQKRNLFDPVAIAGALLMSLLFMGVATIYLHEHQKDVFFSNRKLALLGTVLILSLLLAKGVEIFLLTNTSNFVDLVRFPLFVPFAAIIVSSLFQVRLAGFVLVFLSLIFGMALAVESMPFLVINILTSMVAVLSVRGVRRRKEIFFVCAKAWLASLFVILAFTLYQNVDLQTSFATDLTSTFLFMFLTAILVVGLLPILESTFQVMTDITLMEFMDPSNELLKRLTIEAPGTYQHSMVVGHISEAAASAIGANGLFCRVSTQYHDIGKLANPQYFTENQLGGMDMHQLLIPLESAQVIIAHVSEGVAMARKEGLPEPFIDIIKEHHGTTLVYFFYHKQLELMQGDKTKIDADDFRYSGPKPRTKESTIIMIADTLEAASRSLDLFNEETVTNLVDTLISQKMEDGQLSDSILTFEELGVVKKTIIKTLLAASHPRIKYPPHHPGEEG
ncbi:MAG: Cyclic-di-AMP phosphodiesterase PgpH [Chlamydiae bacterium]|nr:Cyclic-di-AMP phosphodiesterase PgpH [Chlamydiota bacterium]